jgi:hypothetical protein
MVGLSEYGQGFGEKQSLLTENHNQEKDTININTLSLL